MRARLSIAIALIALVSLVAGGAVPPRAALPSEGAYVEQASSDAETVPVIVTAGDSAAAAHAVVQAGGQVSSDLWLIDAVAATIPGDKLELLATLPGHSIHCQQQEG